MSSIERQKQKLRTTFIPVVNHPYGRVLISLKNAKQVARDCRGVILEGVLHWYNGIRRQPERDEGYRGPTQGEYHHLISEEVRGEGGPVVRQIELTLESNVKGAA